MFFLMIVYGCMLKYLFQEEYINCKLTQEL